MGNRYNFTDPYGKNVEDKMPDWLKDLKIEKKDNITEIEKIKNLYTNSSNKVRKCSICGSVLAPNEVGKCGNCRKL